MTREEAIARIELAATEMTGTLATTTEPSAAEVLQRYIDAHDMAISALREQPQWVSVDERLPEERGSYLTFCKSSGYTNVLEWDGCYDGIAEELHGRALWYDHDSEWGTYEVDCVTHWMPLPSAEGLK